jgi:predicted DNA-binding helix-hairpin-helix protein
MRIDASDDSQVESKGFKPMELQRKLEILADAAKYDASCASSGTELRNSSDGKGLGSTAPGMGICHSYAPDGRGISLLKVLLTNACNYDCLYCVNRASSNVVRARFTIDEVVKLTLDFYRRNYIRSADYTMEQVVSVARKLREEHHFRGYIHLKTIPEADDALIAEAGKYADRLSINIEMPLETSLAKLAPEKDVRAIRRTMGRPPHHCERSEAIETLFCGPVLLRGGACHRTRIRATRWHLAMTEERRERNAHRHARQRNRFQRLAEGCAVAHPE